MSKNMSVDKLPKLVKEYSNTIHRKIKMKSADVKPETYINSGADYNTKTSKIKVGNYVRILYGKNAFSKGILNTGLIKFL